MYKTKRDLLVLYIIVFLPSLDVDLYYQTVFKALNDMINFC